VRGGGEGGHVQSDLGDQFLGGVCPDARDLVQALDRLEVGVDEFGDLRVQGGDVRGEGVDAAQHGRADEP
jgi:hypothetical protein